MSPCRACVGVVSLLFALSLWATDLYAQTPVTRFEELSGVIGSGDRVRVTDLEGVRIDGRVVALTSGVVRVSVRGQTREIPLDSVLAVDRKRHDPWWNGLAIGAAAGAGAGAIADAADDCSGWCIVDLSALYIPVFAVIGAGTGGVIDLSISRYDPVFERPATGRELRFRLEPVVASGERGFRLAVSF